MRIFAPAVLSLMCVASIAHAEPNTPSTYGPGFTNNSTGTVGGGSNFLSAIEHYFNWHPGNGSITWTGVPTVTKAISTPITKQWLQQNYINPSAPPRHFYGYPASGSGGSASTGGSIGNAGHHDSNDG